MLLQSVLQPRGLFTIWWLLQYSTMRAVNPINNGTTLPAFGSCAVKLDSCIAQSISTACCVCLLLIDATVLHICWHICGDLLILWFQSWESRGGDRKLQVNVWLWRWCSGCDLSGATWSLINQTVVGAITESSWQWKWRVMQFLESI